MAPDIPCLGQQATSSSFDRSEIMEDNSADFRVTLCDGTTCGDHQRLDCWMMDMVGIRWVAVHKIGSSLAWNARQRASLVAWGAENKI